MKTFTWVVALAAIGGPACADDIPHRKAGQWEITSQQVGSKSPPMTQRICLDRETDELMYRHVAGAGMPCTKLDIHANGKTVTVSAVCNFGKSQLTSTGVTTFSGDAAYHTVIHGRFEPPTMGGTGETQSTQDGKWTGACPADMRPGDIVMKTPGPNGHEMRMNLRTLAKP
jgi:hypothetical protein